MGEYMEVAIFKKLRPVNPFFGNNMDYFLHALKHANTREKEIEVYKEYRLFDTEKNLPFGELLRTKFWEYKGETFYTHDGLPFLEDIFKPLHFYYKYHIAGKWLILLKPEEYELNKTQCKSVIPASLILERYEQLYDLYVQNGEKDERFDKDFNSPIFSNGKVSLHDVITLLNDDDLVYLTGSEIFYGATNEQIVESITETRNQLTSTSELYKEFTDLIKK